MTFASTTVLSASFIDLRSDYGSTWNGDLIIRNCRFYPNGISNHIIKADNSEDHNFGYTCYLPQKIIIEGLYVHRIGKSYLFNNVNPKHKTESYEAEFPIVPPEEVFVKDFSSLFFKDLSVSKNKSMFRVEISS